MTFAARLLLLASFGLTPLCQGQQSAFLETVPITFKWNLATTGVTRSTINDDPPVVDPSGDATNADGGFLDPDKISPLARISTETGRPIVYAPQNPTVYGGNQNFFIRQSYQTLVYLSSPEEYGGVIAGTVYDGRWEITAIRDAQTSVEGVGSTPYTFWLTRIDFTTGRPTRMLRIPAYETFPILPVINHGNGSISEDIHLGLSITYGKPIGSFTEEFVGDGLSRASGTVTIPITIRFGSVFYDDFPLTRLQRNVWDLVASGYMTVSLKTNKGTVPVLAGTSLKLAASGAFLHNFQDFSDPTNVPLTFTGIGPVKIVGGVPKYQNREFLTAIGYSSSTP